MRQLSPLSIITIQITIAFATSPHMNFYASKGTLHVEEDTKPLKDLWFHVQGSIYA